VREKRVAGALGHARLGYAPPMRLAAVRRAIPRPLKRSVSWLRGWIYWARRRVRELLSGGHRASVAGTTAAPATTAAAGLEVTLPADAPDSIVARNEHGVYCVPRASQHRPVAQAILQSQVWEADTLDLVRGADSHGDIVHAGTFFGDFLPALAHSRSDGALVWAFEPNGENHRCAQITKELNHLENVVLANAGVNATGGTALLATTDREGLPLGGASRVITDPARTRWWANEEVKLVAVDEVVPSDREVAVIQFDVEGHEQEALDGAMRTIERCRPLIVLETLPEASWVERKLVPLGYRQAGSVDENVVLRRS
jgi:FkbM family methyltransferase